MGPAAGLRTARRSESSGCCDGCCLEGVGFGNLRLTTSIRMGKRAMQCEMIRPPLRSGRHLAQSERSKGVEACNSCSHSGALMIDEGQAHLTRADTAGRDDDRFRHTASAAFVALEILYPRCPDTAAADRVDLRRALLGHEPC